MIFLGEKKAQVTPPPPLNLYVYLAAPSPISVVYAPISIVNPSCPLCNLAIQSHNIGLKETPCLFLG